MTCLSVPRSRLITVSTGHGHERHQCVFSVRSADCDEVGYSAGTRPIPQDCKQATARVATLLVDIAYDVSGYPFDRLSMPTGDQHQPD
jgi:hypothetical protein